MRIAYDISKALSPCDGIGIYSRRLLEAMCGCPGDHRLLLCDPRGHVDLTEAAEELSELARVEICDYAELAGDFDVFLATSWAMPSAWRGPTLFVCYDLTFLSHRALHTVVNRTHCLEGCLRALLADARWLAISDATAHEAETRLGLKSSQIEVVYPAAGAEMQQLADVDLPARLAPWGLTAGGYVLAVGSLEPRKNLQRLIAAHGDLDEELRRAYPLILVGGGGWRNEHLRQQLAQRQGDETLKLLGRVDSQDLVALYNGARAFAYPSLVEGFGLPVVEAMACGTPVLTSDTSSLPEAAGSAALMVPPDDTVAMTSALTSLLTDEELHRDLQQRGLAQAATFSWHDSAARILELLAEMSTPLAGH